MSGVSIRQWRVRQRQEEGCALIRCGRGPNTAAVFVNDSLNICQTDSGALELGRLMEALKHAEQLAGVRHIKAGAVIADENHPLPVDSGLPDLNHGLGAEASELDGVRKQIYE